MVFYDVEKKRRIIVPINTSEVNSAVQSYIINRNVRFLGLDCEWVSTGKCVALIQIATEEHVILIQAWRFQFSLPERLSDVLKDKRVVKVGVNIEEDVRRIEDQFIFENVTSWLDLRCLAIRDRFSLSEPIIQQFKNFEANLVNVESETEVKAKRGSFMPKLGLAALVEHFLRLTLPKSKSVQVWGDWEAVYLSRELKLYAAADAAASLDVCLQLKSADIDYLIRRIKAKEMLFKYPPYYQHPDDFTWESLLEKPCNQHNIRLECLDRIAKLAPEMWQILPDYHGRSNSRNVQVTNECSKETTRTCECSKENVNNVTPPEKSGKNICRDTMELVMGFFMLGLIGIGLYNVITVITHKDFTFGLYIQNSIEKSVSFLLKTHKDYASSYNLLLVNCVLCIILVIYFFYLSR